MSVTSSIIIIIIKIINKDIFDIFHFVDELKLLFHHLMDFNVLSLIYQTIYRYLLLKQISEKRNQEHCQQ